MKLGEKLKSRRKNEHLAKEDFRIDYIIVFKNQRPELCKFPDSPKFEIWKE